MASQPAIPSHIVIYSDLDGTFLDHHTYSYAESLPALHMLEEKKVPVIFCSSKTRAEFEPLRQELPGNAPFITENGAAIYIPSDFFDFPIQVGRIDESFIVIEMGSPYARLKECFQKLKSEFPGKLIGFSDMTGKEVAAASGLSIHQARLAKQREYSEVFKFTGTDEKTNGRILIKIEEYGFKWSKGGRYFHLHGDNDKGKAVKKLNTLFGRARGRIVTFGIGDSLNDLPLLEIVDVPVLVKKGTGTYDKQVLERLPHVRLADGIGPKGWSLAVKGIIADS
jgi:mannosyl-3-phosphoglycerate phosphatase